MQNRRSICSKGLIAFLLILLTWATSSVAGQVMLAWDPNPYESGGIGLIGYNLYYQAGSSAAADPDNANLIYIPLSDPDFDPNNPSYQITGLSDSEQYFFVVTAMYGDEESGMSNEVSSSTSGSRNINTTADSASTGSSSGGCFIGSLR